jgi:hypothetical protein
MTSSRCGAADPHDLTTRSLRLPPGHRPGEDRGSGRLNGLENGTCGASH